VAPVEDVVLALGTSRKPADTAELPQRPKPIEAAGQELVRVRLVTRVPHDLVDGRVHESVQHDCQLDHAEGAAEVTTGMGDRLDDRSANLAAELTELLVVEPLEVAWT
jgi:hypothetical protein